MTDTAPLPNFDPLDPEHVKDAFMERIADLRERFEDLKGSHARCPEKVESDADMRRFTDHVKNLKACAKAFEEARKAEKGKYDECGKVVHGIAKGFADDLAKWAREAEQRMTDYQTRVAQEEERRRQEEERKKREEAERLAQEAKDADTLEDAIRAEEAAEKARREAEAKPADLHRARGEYGGVSSLRSVLAFEVLDIHAVPLETLRRHFSAEDINKAVRGFMSANREEVKERVKRGDGEGILRGIRFYEDKKTTVR